MVTAALKPVLCVSSSDLSSEMYPPDSGYLRTMFSLDCPAVISDVMLSAPQFSPFGPPSLPSMIPLFSTIHWRKRLPVPLTCISCSFLAAENPLCSPVCIHSMPLFVCGEMSCFASASEPFLPREDPSFSTLVLCACGRCVPCPRWFWASFICLYLDYGPSGTV